MKIYLLQKIKFFLRSVQNGWEKYHLLFPMPNYLLIKEPSVNCPNVINVIFINKKKFIKKVNDHINVFTQNLDTNLTGESLLIEIEKTKRFASVIKNNEMLWGILLGYGVCNSELYSRRSKLEQFINYEELPYIPQNKPLPNKKFSSIEEECEYLDSKLKLFGEYAYSPLVIRSVNFVSNKEHGETKFLEKKYRNLRCKLSAIYAKGDFLEITLSKLTSND
jgi:hypothetical protein